MTDLTQEQIDALEGMISRRMENTGETRDEAIFHIFSYIKNSAKSTNEKGLTAETAWNSDDMDALPGAPRLKPGHYYTNTVVACCSNTIPDDWEQSKTHDCSRYMPAEKQRRG